MSDGSEWVELSINTTHEAVDWVRSLLSTTDYCSDLVMTPYEAPPLPEATLATAEPWAFTICLYLPHDAQARDRVNAIDHKLSALYRTGMISSLEAMVIDRKPPAHPTPVVLEGVDHRFVLLPVGLSTSPQAHDIPIHLPSSLAFGSGLHPTTLLCLKLIERHITGNMQTLDLGSGTGILSIAMAKLGAQVLALDNDPVAIAATQTAVDQNYVANQVVVQQGSLEIGSELGHWMGLTELQSVSTVPADHQFDAVVANMLARIHVSLASHYRQALRSSGERQGVLITSGYTADYEEEIKTAFATAGLEPIDSERTQEWVAWVHRLAS